MRLDEARDIIERDRTTADAADIPCAYAAISSRRARDFDATPMPPLSLTALSTRAAADYSRQLAERHHRGAPSHRRSNYLLTFHDSNTSIAFVSSKYDAFSYCRASIYFELFHLIFQLPVLVGGQYQSSPPRLSHGCRFIADGVTSCSPPTSILYFSLIIDAFHFPSTWVAALLFRRRRRVSAVSNSA